MDLQHLAEAALQSPVPIALITGAVAIIGGRWIIDAKDAQLKVKDEQIAALQLWMPANIVEQLEATKKLYELRHADASEAIELLSNQSLSQQQIRERLELLIGD